MSRAPSPTHLCYECHPSPPPSPLGYLQPFRDGGLSKAAEAREGGVVLVEAHGDVEPVALLLLLEADGERAPHRVAQALALTAKQRKKGHYVARDRE